MKKFIKRTIALILSVMMVIGMLTLGASAADTSARFTDISGSPYAEAIEVLAEDGIVNGIGGGKYGTDQTLTRAEVVTVLGRMADAEQKDTDRFSDVDNGTWYSGYVGWAEENGIVEGVGGGLFDPWREITGYELDLMLSRYAKLAGIDYTATNTSKEPLTRGEMAQMVYALPLPGNIIAQNVAYVDDGTDAHVLDVHDAVGPDTKQPLVIEIHGGGGVSGNKEINSNHSDYYAENGFKVLNTNYTLMPVGDYKTFVQDIFTVFDWAVKHADEYNYDLDQVFLSGDSAGANIVILLAAVINSPELQKYYEVTPPTDITFKGYILTCPMGQADLIDALDRESEGFDLNKMFAGQIGADILKNEDLMNHVLWDKIIDPETFPEVYIITTPQDEVYYTDALALTALLDERDIDYVCKEYTVEGLFMAHTFNINSMDHPQSIVANADAVAYMKKVCDRPDTMIAQDLAYINDGSEFHLLDVYDSVGTDTRQPLVIEIHGGGLIGGTKETNLMHSDYYSKNGFKVVTPNYTLMPNGNYKTIVQDLFAMFDWVGQHADKYNYNLDQVFLSGDSAGGYIVSLLATVLNTPELQEYYEVTPPTDITFKGFILTCPMADQEDLVRALDGEQENFLNAMIFAPRIGADILKNEDIMSHAILFNIINPETFPEVYIITTPDGGDAYYRDAVMLRDFLEENGISYVYKEYSKIEHDLGHVFNIDNDKIDYIESKMANDDAIAYMLSLCK